MITYPVRPEPEHGVWNKEGIVPNNPNNIKVGDLILRDVEFSWTEPPRMADLRSISSDRGEVIFRAVSGFSQYLVDSSSWVVSSVTKRGLVCFCYFPLPSDTSRLIGFEVKRISNNGRSVCVKPVFGTLEDLLEYYKVPAGSALLARQA